MANGKIQIVKSICPAPSGSLPFAIALLVVIFALPVVNKESQMANDP
jgi:hypothetical protein